MQNQVAQTILAQLGGGRFIAMTGAKNFLGRDNGVSFKVGSNDKKVTHVRITLNSRDLYDVDYLAIRGVNVRTVTQSAGIYCDNLRADFETETGLRTSL